MPKTSVSRRQRVQTPKASASEATRRITAIVLPSPRSVVDSERCRPASHGIESPAASSRSPLIE
jgi:hypothetical protein